MNSAGGTAALPAVGFPIRTSPDQSLVSGSPTLFAATHVLLRLLSPRHPSCALCSLVISLPAPSPSSRRPGSSAAPWLTGAALDPGLLDEGEGAGREMTKLQRAHEIGRAHV